MRTQLFPLRTLVKSVVPLQSVSLVDRASGVKAPVFTGLFDLSSDPQLVEQLRRFYPGPGGPPPGLDPSASSLPFPPQPSAADPSAEVEWPCPVLGRPFASFWAVGETDPSGQTDSSRDLWIDVELRVKKGWEGVVGGICFAGNPYLPYSVTAQGENSANFGLPREIRLTWETHDRRFIDSAQSLTRQQVVSHSGVHVIAVPPYRARNDRPSGTLRIRFSDFPRLLLRFASRPDRPASWREVHAILIPWLYPFVYEEGTRFRPRVRSGLLAATHRGVKEAPPDSSWAALLESQGAELPGLDPSFVGPPTFKVRENASELLLGPAGGLHAFSAGSLFGQRRFYPPPNAEEFYASNPVLRGDRIVLFLEQAEEFERCIAGLRLTMPPEMRLRWRPKLGPRGTTTPDPDDPRSRLDGDLELLLRQPRSKLSVYELDPPEGASPLLVDLSDRYATRIHDSEIDRASLDEQPERTIRFVRPSMARYFALVFDVTGRDGDDPEPSPDRPPEAVRHPNPQREREPETTAQEETRPEEQSPPGQGRSDEPTGFGRPAGGTRRVVMIKRLEFVQSVHVSVGPRAARDVRIRAAHFRIIGPDLAADYARMPLLEGGLAVERIVARERASVLFEARTLLDLIHSGVGKLHANQRYWETLGEHTSAKAATPRGWQRSETGSDGPNEVTWDGDPSHAPPQGSRFAAQSSSESRTKTEHVNTFDRMIASLDPTRQDYLRGVYVRPEIAGASSLDASWAGWKGVPADELDLRGTQTINLPGFSPGDLATATSKIVELASGDFTLAPFEGEAFSRLLVSCGWGANAGIGFIGSVGLSCNFSLPQMAIHHSLGSTGTRVKQGSLTRYAASQQLVSGFSEVETDRAVDPDSIERHRIKGPQIHWQGGPKDLITGSVSLDVAFPGTAGKMYQNADDSIRFLIGVPSPRPDPDDPDSVTIDVWFDVVEEVVRDDF